MGGEEKKVPDKPDSPEKEWETINSITENWVTLEEGEIVFVMSMEWYKQWLAYVHPSDDIPPSSDPPPLINNANIILKPKEKEYSHNQILIQPKLQENVDFIVLPQPAWSALIKWYSGGPNIKRVVISEGSDENKCARVEIYFIPLLVSVCNSKGEPDENRTITVHESKKTTLKDFRDYAVSHLQLSHEPTRMWNAFTTPLEPLNDKLDQTIGDLELVAGQKILIEQKVNGEWTLKTHGSSSSSSYLRKAWEKSKSIFYLFGGGFSSSMNTVGRITTSVSIPDISGESGNTVPGVCGLRNLGNTCFMNSALQCLSNAEPLTRYFVAKKYKDHINVANPLGMKGNLAQQYAITVSYMWSGAYRVVNPRNLKSVVGKFAPRFSGYSQQDSQEFLGFLLDGLHEDLNRVLEKPYIETPDETGDRPDAIVAHEAWDRHTQRNQSIIVDQFQAQLKSTLICPRCQYVSVIFDPYMYLSLPLPAKDLYEVTIIDGSFAKTPNKFGARLPNFCKVGDLLDVVSSESNIDASNLLPVVVSNRRIVGVARRVNNVTDLPRAGVGLMSSRTLNLYEVPREFHKLTRIFVLHRKETVSRFKTRTKELIGTPLVMFVPELTGRELYFLIWKRIQRLIKPEYQDSRFLKEGKSFEESMEEDPNTLWDWVKEEAQKDFTPEELPVAVYKANQFGTHCACKGGKCSCLIEPNNEVVSFSATKYHVSVEWIKPEVYSIENANTQIPSASLLQLREEHKQKVGIRLEDCLELFSESETLGENDMWYCPRCKTHVPAKKKMDLWSSPPILIIHLKRFSQQTRSKITTPVSFPLEGLDLQAYLLGDESKQQSKYDLFAVSQHSGSLSGGHYTAAARNPNGKWYSFNDSSVHEIQTPSGTSSTAYLLFYQRRDERQSVEELD